MGCPLRAHGELCKVEPVVPMTLRGQTWEGDSTGRVDAAAVAWFVGVAVVSSHQPRSWPVATRKWRVIVGSAALNPANGTEVVPLRRWVCGVRCSAVHGGEGAGVLGAAVFDGGDFVGQDETKGVEIVDRAVPCSEEGVCVGVDLGDRLW